MEALDNGQDVEALSNRQRALHQAYIDLCGLISLTPGECKTFILGVFFFFSSTTLFVLNSHSFIKEHEFLAYTRISELYEMLDITFPSYEALGMGAFCVVLFSFSHSYVYRKKLAGESRNTTR